jgi:hypothetical protein
MRCTLLSLLQRRNVLPFHQKRTPKRHQMVMSAALVMIGVMKLCHVSLYSNVKNRKKRTHPPSSKA